jgi:hypothetical protein
MEYLSISGNKLRFKTGDEYLVRALKSDGSFELRGEKFLFDSKSKEIQIFSEPSKPDFDINERYQYLAEFVDMTIDSIIPSVIICGEAGLGKSHTVLERFAKKGKRKEQDYVIVKGYSTSKGLYKILWENRNKTIVLDDIDSVLKDDVSLNLLKAALDSYSERIVTWNSVGFIDDGLPTSFEFNGQVVFITNKSLESLDSAVKSRALAVDVTMNTEEKITRMREIVKTMIPEVNLSTKNKVIDFIEENANVAKELNFRTLIKAIKIYETTQSMRPVQYMLCNS